jgi:hypothetical protein
MRREDLKDPFPCEGEEELYPVVGRALDTVEHPYLLLVKNPQGLYCRETLTADDPSLELAAQTLCLCSVMIVGWMLANDGPGLAREFVDRLHQGLVAFLEDEDRYQEK